MENHYNRQAAAEAQKQYAEAHECPMFAPKNGWCYHCGQNIYEPLKTNGGMLYGYSVEYCSEHLITGCPFCHHTFAD